MMMMMMMMMMMLMTRMLQQQGRMLHFDSSWGAKPAAPS